MTIYTGTPFAIVFSAINREVLRIVVESGWRPGRFRVTGSTIVGKLQGRVVGVRCTGIIGCVTTVAGIWRGVVVAIVASGAVVGDGRVCPVQRIIIVVYRECRRFPARRGRVTHRTIRWEVQRHVVRIGSLVEIRAVTAVTSIRRIGIIPVVTRVAIAGNRNVCARERINSTVVKRRRYPGCFRVARGAICGELRSSVVGGRRVGIIGRMTTVAGIRRGIVVAVVARSAIVGDGRVCPVQRIIIVVDRECRRFPARRGRVTHRTIRREVQRYVVRIGGLIEIRVVTAVTSVRRIGEIAVVTRIAIAGYRNVRARERINSTVIKRRGRPGCFRVARGAICGELRSSVIGRRRTGIIGCVTAVAGIRCVGVVPLVTRVAIAGNRNVRALERINSTVVKRRGRPGCFRVARGAICGELRSSVIGRRRTGIIGRVTAVAGIRRGVVIAVVASGAVVGDGRVCSVQRIIIVVYRERGRFPAGHGRVAHRTIRREVQCHVVRIGGLIEIRAVTAVTSVWRVGEIAVVTCITIAGNRNVRARERINNTVVKRRGRPSCFRVAGGAIRGELRCSVIGHRRIGIIGRMTAVAGIRRGGIVAVVASGAVVGDGQVCPVQRIIIVVDRERGWFPASRGGVAHRTIRREIQCHVVRISCLVEIRGVTGGTLRGCTDISSGMTFNTISRKVRAR
jgi:hypothetical protein